MFGIVSDEEFTKQIEKLNNNNENKNSQSHALFQTIERGRGSSKEVPIELKKVIAEESINGTLASTLASAFSVSESSISAYKNDATSTSSYHQSNEELAKHNDAIRTSILEGARGKLLMALENITEEKLEGAKLRDTASVAKDMSAIIRNLEPSNGNDNNGLKQQFIFYAPKEKSEKDFQVIELRD